MYEVRAKKHLGQHFLKDENIARKIVESLHHSGNLLEIGPGTGVLTKYLIQKANNFKVIEIDSESVEHLDSILPELKNNIIKGDFLKLNFSNYFDNEFAIIGNFPYNISSQIFFKVIENRGLVPEVVCMIQKEVAERLAAPPKNKTYGILSVLLGAFYDIELLFTVSETVFFPPPKVKSAVIRLRRKENFQLDCDERMFFDVVKTAFNQRRKTMRNSLKKFWYEKTDPNLYPVFKQRPEELSVAGFVALAKIFS